MRSCIAGCGHSIDTLLDWNSFGLVITGPSCGAHMRVAYDESYDPDSGDEVGWFYLEPVE